LPLPPANVASLVRNPPARAAVCPGAFVPPAGHGAWKVSRDAHAGHAPASSPRLRKPASRSCSASTGSAARACPAWATATSTGAPWPAGGTPAVQPCQPASRAGELLRYLGLARAVVARARGVGWQRSRALAADTRPAARPGSESQAGQQRPLLGQRRPFWHLCRDDAGCHRS